MKKLLLLAAALVMSVGSVWADGHTVSELGNGKIVTIDSYHWGNHVWVDGTTFKATSAAVSGDNYKFQLIGSNTDGYKLKNVGTSLYIAGPTGTTNDAANATVYKILDSTPGGAPSGGVSYTQNGTHTVVFQLATDASKALHQGGATNNLEHYGFGTTASSWGGSTWVITSVEVGTPEGPSEAEITALQNKISGLVALDGPIMTQKVGYPSAYSQSVCDLMNMGDVTADNYDEAQTAYSAVINETDVNLPAAGKSYYIRPFYKENVYGYLYDNGTKLTSSKTLPSSGAVFVATKVNGNQMAFKIAGTTNYYRWTSGDAPGKSNPTTGYTAYDETYSTQTLLKAVTTQEKGGPVNSVSGITNADLFGLLEINGKGTDNNTYFLINRADGAFVAGNHDDKYYDNTENGRTVYYAFEEAPATAYELEVGATGYSTLYLDKNVIIPEGVTAYYCVEDGDKLQAVAFESGEVIPSEVGVVIEATTPNTTYQFPYTETEYTGSKNPEDDGVLTGTTVASSVSAYSVYFDNIYVLSTVEGNLGFYQFGGETLKANRAFYATNDGAVQGFVLDFGNGEQTTGVSQLSTINCQLSTAYDLAGRRVNASVKGISIVNGKKVIR